MKATELMIGDWVNLTYTDRLTKETVSKNFQVAQMRDDYGVLCAWTKGKTCDHNMDAVEKLKPIALTPEILEKNGFERFGTSYILREYLFELTNPSMPDNYLDNYWLNISSRCINIKYVHELQHALRLCGIEKEIVL